ncbi:MAG TPA: hypothetical protein VNA12_02565 [Mycobacteriales bacterium]|nr:hypothetical protein [Mycobacteriales bacterium]
MTATTVMQRRMCAATAAVVLLVGGCTEDAEPPDVVPVPADGLTASQRRLAEMARLAEAATYDATYTLRAASGETGTIRIIAAPPSYRVDVALRGAAPSSYIQRDDTVVSCTTKAGRTSCFRVAGPGEAVPELFDPGVQRLFSAAVADLAAHPEAYVVADAVAPTPGGEAGAACFDVRRTAPSGSADPATASPTADPTGFETGQYCFGTDGVLTRVAVSTGTLDLASRGPAPTADAFVPPASPVALPSLQSASPS